MHDFKAGHSRDVLRAGQAGLATAGEHAVVDLLALGGPAGLQFVRADFRECFWGNGFGIQAYFS